MMKGKRVREWLLVGLGIMFLLIGIMDCDRKEKKAQKEIPKEIPWLVQEQIVSKFKNCPRKTKHLLYSCYAEAIENGYIGFEEGKFSPTEKGKQILPNEVKVITQKVAKEQQEELLEKLIILTVIEFDKWSLSHMEEGIRLPSYLMAEESGVSPFIMIGIVGAYIEDYLEYAKE